MRKRSAPRRRQHMWLNSRFTIIPSRTLTYYRAASLMDLSLNTVNIGKYELGWASIGICTHAFYEAIDHAANRNLYGKYVTDFPHVKKLFTEAFARLVAMKLFALRACDYLRSANENDRRYLLYNPIQKMKVTMEGERIIDLLHEVIAAKGFEQDTYFEMAVRDIGMLPKLEGTTHVNMALVVKFLKNFLFAPAEYAEVPKRNDIANDTFLFNQGATSGLGKITFNDYNEAFNGIASANLEIFKADQAFKRSDKALLLNIKARISTICCSGRALHADTLAQLMREQEDL